MIRRLLPLSLLFAATAAAKAQFPGGFNMPNLEYNPLLLINPQVQKELGIPAAQAPKFQQTFMQEAMKVLPAISGGQNLSRQQQAAKVMAAIGHMEARLAAMLSPTQRVRLRQLTLQSLGAAAVLQPKVSQSLAITPGQRGQILSAVSASNEKLAERLRGGVSQRSLPEMTRLQAQAKTESNQALASILKPAQRAKWQAMLGRPFAMSGFLGAGNLAPMMGGR